MRLRVFRCQLFFAFTFFKPFQLQLPPHTSLRRHSKQYQSFACYCVTTIFILVSFTTNSCFGILPFNVYLYFVYFKPSQSSTCSLTHSTLQLPLLSPFSNANLLRLTSFLIPQLFPHYSSSVDRRHHFVHLIATAKSRPSARTGYLQSANILTIMTVSWCQFLLKSFLT